MSFDLYLQSFRDGEAAGIPIDAIRSAFGSALTELEDDFWQVVYGPADSSDLFLRPLASDPELIHNISIHRPCCDARLFRAIWTLLEFPGTCLYFPGETPPLTRDASMADSMPADMVEALGTPILIDSAEAIPIAIQNDPSHDEIA